MNLEKVFYLSVGRLARIVVHGRPGKRSNELLIDLEFSIKDNHDTSFRPPIGVNHPQYWKLKNADPAKSQKLQLEYSGISRKQLKEAIQEFQAKVGPGYTFVFNNQIETRVKNLKGIRVNALTRRMLSVA